MNNETLMKIASKVIENRMKQAYQSAFNKVAADAPVPPVPVKDTPVPVSPEQLQEPIYGGGVLTPTYLDLLRANAPAVGAVAGGLGGATLGAVISRKARIRNALIGLLAGAALGGGAGYLMNR